MKFFDLPAKRKYQVPESARQIKEATSRPLSPPSLSDLEDLSLSALAEAGRQTLLPDGTRIMVGNATCGRAAGSQKILEDLRNRRWSKSVTVVEVGCIGACFAEPLVVVATKDGRYYFFTEVDTYAMCDIIKTAEGTITEPRCAAIAQQRQGGALKNVDDLEFMQSEQSEFSRFLGQQTHRISGRCGLVSPYSLMEYATMGGYESLKNALKQSQPAAIMELIAEAGLRGRGGAGFPTAQKMRIVADHEEDTVRYVVANGDEGDPGAYMNRALIESDPHSIIEGMLLAAYAVGASHGYFFIRHEYDFAVTILRQAIEDCYKAGILGEHILDSSFCFSLELVESAGAFVCGEDTALVHILENRRGAPGSKPPYPADRGFEDHPTLVLNVETMANIPWIYRHDTAAFRSLGSSESPGTKMFCLAGDIAHVGYIEVPLGTDTSAIVETIGGGDPEQMKALQIGGPAGGVVPYRHFTIDYESVRSAGASIGSGGLIVLNRERCVVDILCHIVRFMVAESCGQCLFCRDGLAILEGQLLALIEDKGRMDMLSEIAALSRAIAANAGCGLGRAAAQAVANGLRDFAKEFEDHAQHRCTAVYCRALVDFEIRLQACRECHACFLVCPSGAVKYRSGNYTYRVDRERCTKCYACFETCPFRCIRIASGEFFRQ